MSYLCNYSPPAPRQLAPRARGENLPGAARPHCRKGRGQQPHVGLGAPHMQAPTQLLGWLAGVAAALWTSVTQEDRSSIQPSHLVLLLPPSGNTSGIIGFVLAQYMGLWQGISLHVQGCVSSYTGSETWGESFWVVVFLEVGFSQWCYRSCRVVQTPPSQEHTLRCGQNSKN